MDIVELSNIVMGDVKKFIGTKYYAPNKEDQSFYSAVDYNGNEVTINIFPFGATVTSKSLKTVVNYQFLRALGEIFTYYKFQVAENGSLNVIHGRCVRDGEDSFALMAKSANVRYVSCGLPSEKVVSWPYPYYGVTFEETMKLLEKNGSMEIREEDPEYAHDISADKIYVTMEELASNAEHKLSVEPSR